LSLNVRFGLGGLDVRADPVFLFGSGDFLYDRVLWRDDHKGGAVQGIRACGKYLQLLVATIDSKVNLCPAAAADPVALHGFDGVAPVHVVQVFL